jgi:4-hydroxybenzoate polyprenyltransferase
MIAVAATVATGAAFGFALNEVADQEPDLKAGKPNEAARLGRRRWLPFLVLTGAGTLALSLAWAPDAAGPVLVVLSLAVAWCYSVRPIRLKERGLGGIAGAAAAQWSLPMLVVAAVERGGWHRLDSVLFAFLSTAIGVRSIVVHQLGDAPADRRAGVRTYLSERADVHSLLRALFACELVLLAFALALTLPRSLPAVIALAVSIVYELSPLASAPLRLRLARNAQAPLGGYYFFAFPVAVAVGEALRWSLSIAIPILLLGLALPQLVGALRVWRRR